MLWKTMNILREFYQNKMLKAVWGRSMMTKILINMINRKISTKNIFSLIKIRIRFKIIKIKKIYLNWIWMEFNNKSIYNKVKN